MEIMKDKKWMTRVITVFISVTVFAVMYLICSSVDLPWSGYTFGWLTHKSRAYNRVLIYESIALLTGIFGLFRLSNMLTFGSWVLIICGDILGHVPDIPSENMEEYVYGAEYGWAIYILGMLVLFVVGCVIEILLRRRRVQYDEH